MSAQIKWSQQQQSRKTSCQAFRAPRIPSRSKTQLKVTNKVFHGKWPRKALGVRNREIDKKDIGPVLVKTHTRVSNNLLVLHDPARQRNIYIMGVTGSEDDSERFLELLSSTDAKALVVNTCRVEDDLEQAVIKASTRKNLPVMDAIAAMVQHLAEVGSVKAEHGHRVRRRKPKDMSLMKWYVITSRQRRFRRWLESRPGLAQSVKPLLALYCFLLGAGMVVGPSMYMIRRRDLDLLEDSQRDPYNTIIPVGYGEDGWLLHMTLGDGVGSHAEAREKAVKFLEKCWTDGSRHSEDMQLLQRSWKAPSADIPEPASSSEAVPGNLLALPHLSDQQPQENTDSDDSTSQNTKGVVESQNVEIESDDDEEEEEEEEEEDEEGDGRQEDTDLRSLLSGLSEILPDIDSVLSKLVSDGIETNEEGNPVLNLRFVDRQDDERKNAKASTSPRDGKEEEEEDDDEEEEEEEGSVLFEATFKFSFGSGIMSVKTTQEAEEDDEDDEQSTEGKGDAKKAPRPSSDLNIKIGMGTTDRKKPKKGTDVGAKQKPLLIGPKARLTFPRATRSPVRAAKSVPVAQPSSKGRVADINKKPSLSQKGGKKTSETAKESSGSQQSGTDSDLAALLLGIYKNKDLAGEMKELHAAVNLAVEMSVQSAGSLEAACKMIPEKVIKALLQNQTRQDERQAARRIPSFVPAEVRALGAAEKVEDGNSADDGSDEWYNSLDGAAYLIEKMCSMGGRGKAVLALVDPALVGHLAAEWKAREEQLVHPSVLVLD